MPIENEGQKEGRVEAQPDETPRHRLRTVLIGSVICLVLGTLLAFAFTYFMYGGTALDSIFGGKNPQPAAGKLAYEKKTGVFIGVVKSQGFSSRKHVQVYYIERPGGNLIEVDQTAAEVRDRPRADNPPAASPSPGP